MLHMALGYNLSPSYQCRGSWVIIGITNEGLDELIFLEAWSLV